MPVYHSVRRTGKLFLHSLRYLLLLEVIFKLIGAIIVFPFCEMLLHVVLRFSKLYYISAQNIKEVFTNPLVVVGMLIILLILLLFLGFEISALAISYQQTYYKAPIGFFQLLKEAFVKTMELFRPKNWLLFPVLIILFPSLLYFIHNSNNNYLTLVQQMFRIGFRRFPINLLLALVLLIVAVLALVGMFAYQFFISEEVTGLGAIKSSGRLLFKRFWHVVSSVLLWLVLVAGALFAVDWIIYLLIHLGTRLFADPSVRTAVRLTITFYVRTVLVFITFSILSFAIYAFSASFYYEYEVYGSGKKLPPLVRKVDPKAGARGRLTISFLLLAFVCTIVVNLVLLYSARRSSGLSSMFFGQKTSIVAHRGFTQNYNENTLGAFQDAIDAQADIIELDVQLTKDGKVAVLHDANLWRCWNIKSLLKDFSSEELSSIVDEDGQHLPLLSEVFDLVKDQNVDLLIELKVNKNNPGRALADGVMDLIEEYDIKDRCVIQTFNYPALRWIKQRDENMICGLILNGSIGTYYDLECADFFSINMLYVTESMISAVHLRDKMLLVWTVNTDTLMNRAVEYQVNGVITDEPILARETIYRDSFQLIENLIPEEESEGLEEPG